MAFFSRSDNATFYIVWNDDANGNIVTFAYTSRAARLASITKTGRTAESGGFVADAVADGKWVTYHTAKRVIPKALVKDLKAKLKAAGLAPGTLYTGEDAKAKLVAFDAIIDYPRYP